MPPMTNTPAESQPEGLRAALERAAKAFDRISAESTHRVIIPYAQDEAAAARASIALSASPQPPPDRVREKLTADRLFALLTNRSIPDRDVTDDSAYPLKGCFYDLDAVVDALSALEVAK